MECLARFRLACGQVGELRLGGGAGGPVVPRVVPPRAQGRAAMVSPFLLALLWSLGVDSISLAVSAVSTFRAAGGVTLSPRSAPLAPAPPCSGSAKQPRTRPAPHRAMRAAGPAGRRGRGGVVLEIRLEKLRRSRGVAAARPCPPSADQLCPLSSNCAKCPASLRRGAIEYTPGPVPSAPGPRPRPTPVASLAATSARLPAQCTQQIRAAARRT